jgi:putative Mn2+ efflux pump MntP
MILLLTAFSVSIDAFTAGVAISVGSRTGVKHVACVLIFTFVLTSLALLLGVFLSKYISVFSIIGASLLILLGTKNLACANKTTTISLNAPLVGISVGMDATLACLTLSVPFLQVFAVAIIMSVFHGVFFVLGGIFSKVIKRGNKVKFASGVFLILLGIYRLF